MKARDFFSSTAESYPALIILLGILNGIIPHVFELKTPFLSIIPILALMLFSTAKTAIKFALFTMAGIASVWLFSLVPGDNYAKILNRQNCGAIAKAKVVDTFCVSDNVKWLSSPPMIRIKLLSIKCTKDSAWTNASGILMAKLPKDFQRVSYGDELLMDGAFITPETPAFNMGFDYKRFLRTRGISKLFYAQKCEILKKGTGAFRCVLNFRDAIMNKLTKNMDNVENKCLLAALIFGCKQGIDRETRTSFIRSGIIHIFTVSGLHVGILALILGWMLRWLPFRPRYLLLPCFILVYTLATGAHPPAARAFLMIALWCLFRAFLYHTSPLNIVFLSASIILLANPFYIIDMGFQYSFIIAGALVLAGTCLTIWVEMMSERLNWTPASKLRFRTYLSHKMLRYTVSSLLFCSVAWLASSGITLYYQRLYIPGSILSNIVMTPFVLGVFIVSSIKFALEPLIVFSSFLGGALDLMLDTMKVCGEVAARFAENATVPAPPLWSVPLFYLALIVLIMSKRRKIFTLSFATVFAVAAFWHIRKDFEPARLAIFHGGHSQEPAIVICDPADKQAVVINAPSWDAAREVSNYLNAKGISKINTLFLASAWRNCSQGMKYLARGNAFEQITLPENYKRNKRLSSIIKDLAKSGTRISLGTDRKNGESGWSCDSENMKALAGNNCFKIEYKSYGFNFTVNLY